MANSTLSHIRGTLMALVVFGSLLSGCHSPGRTSLEYGRSIENEVRKVRIEMEAIGQLYEQALSQIGKELEGMQWQLPMTTGDSKRDLLRHMKSLEEDRKEILQYKSALSIDFEEYVTKKSSQVKALVEGQLKLPSK